MKPTSPERCDICGQPVAFRHTRCHPQPGDVRPCSRCAGTDFRAIVLRRGTLYECNRCGLVQDPE